MPKFLTFIPLLLFHRVYLHLLTCFGYLDVVGGDLNLGFPRRLLLKPLSTLQLAAIPMFTGGMVFIGVFSIWAYLILSRGTGFLATPWFGACLLSLFWWVQATAWSAPESQAGRSLIVLSVAVVNLLVGLLPLLPTPPAVWVQWTILGTLLSSACLVAVLGLQLVRQGAWVGPSLIDRLWRVRASAQPRTRRKKFRSAFHAQFWLEWQRQGRLLPFLSSALILMLPLFWYSNWPPGGRGADVYHHRNITGGSADFLQRVCKLSGEVRLGTAWKSVASLYCDSSHDQWRICAGKTRDGGRVERLDLGW